MRPHLFVCYLYDQQMSTCIFNEVLFEKSINEQQFSTTQINFFFLCI